MKQDPYLTPATKIKTRSIKDLNVKDRKKALEKRISLVHVFFLVEIWPKGVSAWIQEITLPHHICLSHFGP